MSFFCGACQMQVSDMNYHRASYHPHEVLREQIETELDAVRDSYYKLLEALDTADALDRIATAEALWRLSDEEATTLEGAARVLRGWARREWNA